MSWQNELFSSYILTIIHSLENNNNWTENGGGPDTTTVIRILLFGAFAFYLKLFPKGNSMDSLRDLQGAEADNNRLFEYQKNSILLVLHM